MESIVDNPASPLAMAEPIELASPVTGSNHGGMPSNIHGDIAHSVTYSTEKSSAAVESSKRPSSFDFAEQIRQLEIEGNKLRAATASTLSSFGSLSGTNLEMNDYSTGISKYPSSNFTNLSALVDISADQKAISDLRIQLENQRKETQRLQKQLLGDVQSVRDQSSSYHNLSGSSNGSTNISGSNTTPSIPAYSSNKAAFSTISSTELAAPAFLRRTFDYQPPSHLERSLKESQEQVMDLRKRLQECNEASDQQKRQFRTTVEELKAKLHDTILNRDTVLDLRQKESNSQELLINKLQSSLTQLQEQYKAQEEVLASVTKKAESHSHSSYLQDTALEQIRSLLKDREKKRGQPFFDGDPVSSQNLTMIVHSLERCLQELDHEINIKFYKVSELESEIENQKRQTVQKESNIIKEYQDKMKKEAEEAAKNITALKDEHEKSLYEALDNVSTLKQQVSALHTQMQENEAGHQQELRAKAVEIKELEEKVDDMRTENLQARALWQEKRQALETSLDEVQRELITVKTEKNELVRLQTVQESRLEDLQSTLTRAETELDTERERVAQQRQREEELRSKVMTLELQVSNKQGEIERLECMLDVVKQECSVQVLDKVASAERLERERYLDQIQNLSGQLATMTEKCNRVTVEHQMARSEMDSLRAKVNDLTEKLEKARSQMESALSDKNNLTSVLGNNRNDLERINRDLDHYIKLSEQKADEITELRILVDRQKVQLEEKEKVLNTFRAQSTNITQLMEVNTKANDNIREERDRLSAALSEKSAALEELKASQEAFNRKMKNRDRRVREMEEEHVKLTEELATRIQEISMLEQEKESVLSELRDCKKEVGTLTSSKDALKKELARVKSLMTKEITKLQTKLKESEQEFRLSQKALRSKDMMDCKAVKFADKIQKEMTVKRSEMDLMLSRVHRLEEKLETANKEKAMVEKDKDSLKKSLAKSLLHTEQLTEELQTTQAQNKELVTRVAQLEEELDKARLKCSAASGQVEKYEQDIATLKLKHQLELKELESTRSVNAMSYMTGSSKPSSVSSMQPKKDQAASRKRDSEDYVSSAASDGGDSESRSSAKNTLEMRDARHKDYSEVGRELKALLSEMRGLISGQKDIRKDGSEGFSGDGHRNRKGSPALRLQDLGSGKRSSGKELTHDTDADKSWASKSLTSLGDLSDFSTYKEWRPRSHSLSRYMTDPDVSHNTSFLSKGGYGDVSRLSQSLGSPGKPLSARTPLILIPDTKELCRRLEEKIDSLTQMGGNLQKENKEMAALIHLQGEKLDTVKQIERSARR